MKIISVIGIILTLSACGITPQGQAAKKGIAEYGAKISDAGLENTIWGLCNAASIGSVRRMFGHSEDGAKTYRDLCRTYLEKDAPGADVISQ